MILAESAIYPFIKDYPTGFEIVTYKKNSLILQASEENKYIWFRLRVRSRWSRAAAMASA